MKYCLITFRSVTPAQRGEGVLRKAGIHCTLRRTPRWMEEKGCGYSLQVRHQDAAKAVELLRSGDVPFRKIYLHRDEGPTEELML